MVNEETKEVITETVDKTVSKLRRAGMLKCSDFSSFKKTETLLRRYVELKENANESESKELFRKLEAILETLQDDFYFDIIPLIFFKKQSRETVAEHFDVNCRTITRNKNRLVNQIRIALFTDDYIAETLF